MAERVAETYGWSSLVRKYPTSADAMSFFAHMRWGNAPVCPRPGRCGEGSGITAQKTPHRYWCGLCRKYFNPLTGTTLENTKLDLRRVIHAAYLLMSYRKGVSAKQLAIHLDVSYPTAHYLLARLRVICGESMTRVCFESVAGADEVHIGGSPPPATSPRNRAKPRRRPL